MIQMKQPLQAWIQIMPIADDVGSVQEKLLASERTKELDRFLDLLKALEEIDPEMQIQRLKILILVAKFPYLNTQDLARKAGMTNASVSRNLSSLGEWNPLSKKVGYNLVCGHDFKDDRRNKIHTLTNKGISVISSILDFVSCREHSKDKVHSH